MRIDFGSTIIQLFAEPETQLSCGAPIRSLASGGHKHPQHIHGALLAFALWTGSKNEQLKCGWKAELVKRNDHRHT